MDRGAWQASVPHTLSKEHTLPKERSLPQLLGGNLEALRIFSVIGVSLLLLMSPSDHT